MAITTIIEIYNDEIMPYALDLITSIKKNYLRLVSIDNDMENDDEGDA